jgi:hypothetical protein
MRDRGTPTLPESGVLGEDLASAVIDHVTAHLPGLIDEIELWLRLQSRRPVSYWFWSAPMLSRVTMDADREGIAVATATAGHGRTAAVAEIGMRRDGSLYWRQSRHRARRLTMSPVQKPRNASRFRQQLPPRSS